MPGETSSDTALLRKWVATGQRAGRELECIRRAEMQSIDTRDAVRQIFGSGGAVITSAAPETSGLVEQQAWFARLSKARRKP